MNTKKAPSNRYSFVKQEDVERVAMFEVRESKASNTLSEEDVRNLALMDVPQPIHALEGSSTAPD